VTARGLKCRLVSRTSISGAVDYRLNLLGVRVWKNTCQLIGRDGGRWLALGPCWQLPVRLESFRNMPAARNHPCASPPTVLRRLACRRACRHSGGARTGDDAKKAPAAPGLVSGKTPRDARNARLMASSRALSPALPAKLLQERRPRRSSAFFGDFLRNENRRTIFSINHHRRNIHPATPSGRELRPAGCLMLREGEDRIERLSRMARCVQTSIPVRRISG